LHHLGPGIPDALQRFVDVAHGRIVLASVSRRGGGPPNAKTNIAVESSRERKVLAP
jgi:hypothetical protein